VIYSQSRTERGRDAIILRDLQQISSIMDWRKQRRYAARLDRASSQRAVIDPAIAAGIIGNNTLTGTVSTDWVVVYTDSAPVSLINLFGGGIVVASQLGGRRA
jgi:hypothetical protein